MGRIGDIKQVYELLARAYRIETSMEIASQWDAYERISDRCRETLVGLSGDCVKHAQTIRDLSRNLHGLDLGAIDKQWSPVRPGLEGKEDGELFSELLGVEKEALEFYTLLHDTVDPAIIEKHWSGTSSYMDFFVKIRSIMNDEQRHVRIASDLATAC